MKDLDELKFMKLASQAILPTRGSQSSAGLDLYASRDAVIPAGQYSLVNTDIATEIPDQYYGRVAPRSGLAFKNGINVLGGVVDSDYRGEILITLVNHSQEDLVIKIGDRIAQLVIEKIILPTPVWADQLEDSVRGSDGIGSTG